MKNFVLGMLTAVVLLATVAFGYLRLGFVEVRGDLPASHLEDYLMRSAVHAAVRRNAPQLTNPVPATDDNLIAGGKQFLGECSGCHGTPGKSRKYPSGLNPPVPQLPLVGTEYTEAQIFWVAKHGIRRSGMFSNGLWDSDEELWRLAAFVKRIQDLPPHVKEELAKQNNIGG